MKYKVTLYGGELGEKPIPQNIIDTEEVEAEAFDFVNWTDIVRKNDSELDRYARYCKAGDTIFVDFGSWSRFVMIEEVK